MPHPQVVLLAALVAGGVAAGAATAQTQGRPSLTRGPYLQAQGPDRVTVMWQTDVPTAARLAYGSDSTRLDRQAAVPDAPAARAHEVTVTGLAPGTTYYYAVGDAAGALTPASGAYAFTTFPPVGAPAPLRVWVLGDAGTGLPAQLRVRDAYLDYARATGPADLLLLLGDNGYTFGEEVEYDAKFFPPYRDVMRRVPTFPASGNHDLARDGNATTGLGPFFELFAMPTGGEIGGAPSGTEAYYSFDYGDVHFVCLESTELPVAPDAPMLAWLADDLARTRARWLVAYWHFPPYTKGTHDSDDPHDFGGRSILMREVVNPVLEAAGVDLVLTGHSHAYERSALLDGHYGSAATLQPAMVLDGGSGDPTSADGAYAKPDGLVPHAGTVYVVSGSAGQTGSAGPGWPHPAMVTSVEGEAGSLLLDIAGDTLAVRFLTADGVVRDRFAIGKPHRPTPDTTVTDPDTTVTDPDTAVTEPGTVDTALTALAPDARVAVRRVYPNPARGLLYVELDRTAAALPGAVLEVFAPGGRRVLREPVVLPADVQAQALDISTLPPGAYALRLVHAGGVARGGTFIVQ